MSVRNITPQQLKDMLATNPAPFLLDVRESFELMAFGAIPGVVNIPMGQITERVNELPADRSLPLVVVCQSGVRSAEVAAWLDRQGFSAVHNLQGGTSFWLRSAHA
jgi:rhodanese-related sulfurtransferase